MSKIARQFCDRYLCQSANDIGMSLNLKDIYNKAEIFYMTQKTSFGFFDKKHIKKYLQSKYLNDGTNFNVKYKPIRKSSKLANKAYNIITGMGYDLLWEVPLIGKYKYAYDYAFIYRGFFKSYIYFVEIDGGQHFEYTPYFHQSREHYLKAVENDKMKTQNAIEIGYIIRIDNDNINNTEKVIREALNKYFFQSSITTSNDLKYQYLF